MAVFRDEDRAWPVAVPAIRRVAAARLLTGDPDGSFRPTDPVTRQELALILDRQMLLEQELEDDDRVALLKLVANSVVEIRTENGLGSGVVISRDGHILTNAHVVGESTGPEVVWQSGYADETRFPRFVGPNARVLAVDQENDLALLQVGQPGWTEPATIAKGWVDYDSTNRSHVGRRLLIQGSPIGMGARVAEGLFNGLRNVGGTVYLDIDGHVNPGNSGGPIFNSAGELLGLVVAKLVDVTLEGFGLGIPLGRILPFLEICGVSVNEKEGT